MASRISIDTPKPMAVIFLDIEGVLINPSDQKTQDAIQRAMETIEISYLNYPIEFKRVKTHCFSKPALDHLMELIDKISKVADVGIVIASPWRAELNVSTLRDEIFVDMPFAHLIIDKIPDSYHTNLLAQFDGKISLAKPLPSDISEEKYGFSLRDEDKSKEIWFWLLENQERFQIERFVIINNHDSNIVDRYPDHIVQVHPERLFSKSDADESYHALLKKIPPLAPELKPEENIPVRNGSCCAIS